MKRHRAGKLGRKMGVSEIGSQVKLSDYLVDPFPIFQQAEDFTSGVDEWDGMLGNDVYSDCGVVGDVRVCQANAWTAKEEPAGNVNDAMWPTAAEVIATYLAYDGGQDNGVDLGQWLLWRTKNPIGPLPPIGGFAQVSVVEPEYSSALHVFGALYDGVLISQEAMDEFEAGEPWTSTATDWVGGHCSPCLKLPKTSGAPNVPGYGRRYTWSKSWLFTWDWWRATREESYVIFTPAQMNAPSGVFNNVKVAQLKADIEKLHGTL
jgi:hypothetical protein